MRTRFVALRGGLCGLAATLLAVACTAGPLSVGASGSNGTVGGGNGGSSGMTVDAGPPAPVLNSIPTRTPNLTAPIGGQAKDTVEIVIKGGAAPVATPTFPNGSFCADVPLNPGVKNSFTIYALDGEGNISPPATATVTQNPSAPEPYPATCNGEPISDGGINCNIPTQALCNFQCNNCELDGWQPNNDPVAAPYLPPSATYELNVCPCNAEWFALVVPYLGYVDAFVDTYPGVGLSMELQLPPGVDGGGTVVAYATTDGGGGQAELTYLSPLAAEYVLVVFAQADGGAAYTLQLNNYALSIDAGYTPPGMDSGIAPDGPCTMGPGADPECATATQYCDVNVSPFKCVAGPGATQGEPCVNDSDCNFSNSNTEVICSGSSDTCITNACHSTTDCPAGESCNTTNDTCG